MKYKSPIQTKIISGKTIDTYGPYLTYVSPAGKILDGLNYDMWFVIRRLKADERKTEMQILTKESHLGRIKRFSNRKQYIIARTYPTIEFKSLTKAINYLVENEGKIVFCS